MLMDVHASRLPSGLRVVSAVMPWVESMTLGIWVGVGGRHEPRRLSGIGHFIEHLLFKGTRRLSARAISQAIEGRGGHLNAFTQEESTCYYARVAVEHVGRALDVLGEMFLAPRFAPEDIRKERGVIIEEILMYQDQPHHVVEELLGEMLWEDHPLGRPLVGTPETLKGVTRERLLAYKGTRYVAPGTVVAMAGKLGHAECERLVRERFPVPAGGRPAAADRVNGGVKQGRVCVRVKEIEQANLALGFRVFGRRDPRRYALRVLSVILGENMSSRLFQIVREKHGLAYAIQSGFQLYEDTGSVVITAGLDRPRIGKAVALIVSEIRRMQETPVGRAELGRAKDYSNGQLRLSLEGTASQMMWIGENILTRGRFLPPEEAIEGVSAVTAADVQAVAREVFRARKTSLALVSPGPEGDLAAQLEEQVHRLS